MNIFSLPEQEAKQVIKDMLNKIPKEKLIKELKECGFKIREVEE